MDCEYMMAFYIVAVFIGMGIHEILKAYAIKVRKRAFANELKELIRTHDAQSFRWSIQVDPVKERKRKTE